MKENTENIKSICHESTNVGPQRLTKKHKVSIGFYKWMVFLDEVQSIVVSDVK